MTVTVCRCGALSLCGRRFPPFLCRVVCGRRIPHLAAVCPIWPPYSPIAAAKRLSGCFLQVFSACLSGSLQMSSWSSAVFLRIGILQNHSRDSVGMHSSAVCNIRRPPRAVLAVCGSVGSCVMSPSAQLALPFSCTCMLEPL